MDLPPAVVPLCRTGVYENFTWAAAGVAMIPRTAIARMPGCFMGISESEERLLCAAGLTLSIRAIRWLVRTGSGRRRPVPYQAAAAGRQLHAHVRRREVNVSAAPETLGPRYFLRRGCSRKNAHIWRVASTPLLVGPTNHSGSGWPPGQVWPPPLMVES